MKSVRTINDVVDRWIGFRLINFPEELIGRSTGVYHSDQWIRAKLRGFDDLGIWVENPNLEITWAKYKGESVPSSEQKPTVYEASVLIQWKYVGSIFCLDDDDDESSSDKDTHLLGF